MRFILLFVFFTVSLLSENIIEVEYLANSCVSTLEKDEQGRIVKKEIKDENLKTIFLEEVVYDGAELTISDYAYNKDKLRHKAISYYKKNEKGLVTKRILGLGTDNEQVKYYTYTDSGKILSIQSPNGVEIFYHYDEKENLEEVLSSDGTIHYTLTYPDHQTVQQIDHINHITLVKAFDKYGHLIGELFPNGQEIFFKYDNENLAQMYVPYLGTVQYLYDNESHLIKVQRLSCEGDLLYEHAYSDFDDEGNSFKEDLVYGLGQIFYKEIDEETFSIQTPYSQEFIHIRPGCISVTTDDVKRTYLLDKLGQVNQEFDSLGNPIKAKVNERNELLEYENIQCQYDVNGNLIKKITPYKTTLYQYDALDRLSSIICQDTKIRFTYDLEGKRLTKEIIKNGIKIEKQYYIYADDQEIGIQDKDKNFRQLRVLGEENKAIAIETSEGVFVPIYNYNNTILKLINYTTKELIDYSNLEPFGDNLYQIMIKHPTIPWVYASKHFDIESNLIYFGPRYYDPEIKRWLTLDPLGRVQTANLYNYVFNNPLLCIDDDS